jgi:lysozyme
MKPSAACVALVKEFESCRLQAYRDPVGIPTIGWGHTRGVAMGMVISQEQADKWLQEDLQAAGEIVNAWVTVELTQSQFDALVSFVYNVGPGAPLVRDGFVWLSRRWPDGKARHSTIWTKLTAGQYNDAAEEILRWTYAGGRVLPGLVRRRQKERELFLSEPVPESLTLQT